MWRNGRRASFRNWCPQDVSVRVRPKAFLCQKLFVFGTDEKNVIFFNVTVILCSLLFFFSFNFFSKKKKRKDTNTRNKVFSILFYSWHQVIFPKGPPLSIFTSYAFHNQVRDGLVWFHASIDTRNNRVTECQKASLFGIMKKMEFFSSDMNFVRTSQNFIMCFFTFCSLTFFQRKKVSEQKVKKHEKVKINRSISTPQLQPLLAFHLTPINRLVLP